MAIKPNEVKDLCVFSISPDELENLIDKEIQENRYRTDRKGAILVKVVCSDRLSPETISVTQERYKAVGWDKIEINTAYTTFEYVAYDVLLEVKHETQE